MTPITASGEEVRALTTELKRLRHAIERNQRALLTARDASRYIGYSEKYFRRLVESGTVPKTSFEDDMQPRFSRAVLDKVIAEHTQGESA